MKKISKILALMLALVMSVCMFTGCSAESAVEGVVSDFIDAMIEADFEAAAELVGDDTAKQELKLMATMIESDDSVKDAFMENIKDLEYKITDVKIDGDEATVTVEATINGETSSEDILLEKIDGDWLISNM